MKQWICIYFIALVTLVSCNYNLPEVVGTGGKPSMFPDYTDVTIPANIAPLNFKIAHERSALVSLSCKGEELKVKTNTGSFNIPSKDWKRLLQKASGDSIQVVVYERKESGWHRYEPFYLHLAEETIDPYLVYRRIAPGYRMWGEMGLYQRNLESFEEDAILTNKLTHNNCMNCHSFCMQNPDNMVFHQRSTHAGTYLLTEGKTRKLQPKEKPEGHSLVYPHWHPSGRYIAFSSNDTKQDFHLASPNRVEVFDQSSDIFLYDLETDELVSDSLLCSKGNMETFPAFSPDGKTLYFCSSPAQPMPESYEEAKYNLLSLAFDPETRTFGQVIDTLYNAEQEKRSAKFPRISPDGRFLMYTLSDYGNFSIWHRDADLQLLDMETHQADSLPQVNSGDVESYHSWGSNSRWFVFSSRRVDGLYTRPYICYIDKNGVAAKPFLLPQKDADYYTRSLFSFNIPELIKGKVDVSTYDLVQFTLNQDSYLPSTAYSN